MTTMMNFMELYNYFVLNFPKLCMSECLRFVKGNDGDIQLGEDKIVEKYIAPYNMDRRYEKIISLDAEVEESLRKFSECKENCERNLMYVLRGKRISNEEAKDILLATSCFEFKRLNEEYFNSHVYLWPLKKLELFSVTNDKKPEYISVWDIHHNNRSQWVHANGKLYKTTGIPFNHPSILDIVSDVCNLALAFPYLSLTVHIFKYHMVGGFAMLDDDDDNELANGFAYRLLDEHAFREDFIIGFSFNNGVVNILGTDAAFTLYNKFL